MRRGKKTSVPASSVVPALRPRPATKDPEAPLKSRNTSSEESLKRRNASPEALLKSRTTPRVGSPAAGTSPLGQPVQVAEPERRPPPAAPSSDSGSASALGSEINETQESPPPPLPPPVRKGVDVGQWASGLAVEAGRMFNIFRSIPTQMDYKGQKLAEQIFQGIILVSAVIGFIYGYITEQFGWTVYIVMAGFALSCLLTLPPWPIYRRNPLKWLPVQEPATDDKKPADRKVKRHSKN